jgi:hypothetical protein
LDEAPQEGIGVSGRVGIETGQLHIRELPPWKRGDVATATAYLEHLHSGAQMLFQDGVVRLPVGWAPTGEPYAQGFDEE